MTAALEEKSGSKQCSRHFLFFALYCQRADKSIRAVFPFRVLIVAISSSVQEFRRSRVWLRLIGFGVSMRSFRRIFPFCFPNKQVIKMEMGENNKAKINGESVQGCCWSVKGEKALENGKASSLAQSFIDHQV